MTKLEEIRQELHTMRDEIELKIHLGSKDAQREWEELESRWQHFASEADLEKTSDSISSALGLLKEELVEGYRRLKKAL